MTDTTQTISIGADLSPLNASLDTAAKALADFASGPVSDASKSIESAVNGSFNSIAGTIADAVLSGKTSMDQLVDAILDDFDRISIKDAIVKPIEGIVSSAASSLFSSVSGALATGGPVAPGSTYLVGEQGPELFTPSSNGSIASNASLAGASARPSIVFNVQATDAPSFLKSQSQIGAMMLRAMARGQRNL
jgi:phage-related minor tail protein